MKALLAFLAAVLLAGCTVPVADADLLRPQAGPPLDAAGALAALPSGYAVHTDFVETTDGARLYRVRFTHPQARSTALFFPGNAFRTEPEAKFYARSLARAWTSNFVFYDYRGRGQSSGEPTVAALRADALLAFDLERQRAQVEGMKLVLVGFSLGGVVAGAVAEQRRPDAMVLMVTFTNAADVADKVLPAALRPFVSVDIAPHVRAFDNRKAVANYRGPLLVVAAAKDETLPPELSIQVFEAAGTPAAYKTLLVVPNAGHMSVLDSAELNWALAQFVARNGL